MSTIALLFRNAPKEIRIAATMTIDGHEVQCSATAFYDIFDHAERLEDFVRRLADGKIGDAAGAASKLQPSPPPNKLGRKRHEVFFDFHNFHLDR